MPNCSVITCRNRSDTKNYANDGITYHIFPKDPYIKEKWLNATGRGPNWFPIKSNAICSEHFEEKCFQPLKKSRRLFEWATPTLKISKFVSAYNSEPMTSNECSNEDLNTASMKKIASGYTCVTCGQKLISLEATQDVQTTISKDVSTASLLNLQFTETNGKNAPPVNLYHSDLKRAGPSTIGIKTEKEDVYENVVQSPVVCVKTEYEDDRVNTPKLTVYYSEAEPQLLLNNQNIDSSTQTQNTLRYNEAAPPLSLNNQVDSLKCQNTRGCYQGAPLLIINQNTDNSPQCPNVLVYNEAAPLLIFKDQNINSPPPQKTTKQCQNATEDNATLTVKCTDNNSYRSKKELIAIIKSQRLKIRKIRKIQQQNNRLRAKVKKLEEALKEKEKNDVII